MNAVLTTKTTADWVEILEAAGVPCGPAYDYAQMFADPQVRHRGLVQYASDRDWAKCRTSALRSGLARVCGPGPSPQSSVSAMPRSSGASPSASRSCENYAPRAYCNSEARNLALTARRCQEPILAEPPQIGAADHRDLQPTRRCGLGGGNNINAPSFTGAQADRIVFAEFRDEDPSC
jgi:CoA-transferase family III/SAM domain (Sterile alpha motif)